MQEPKLCDLDYKFPKLIKGSSNKMIWGAERSRELFVQEHIDRFKELTRTVTKHDKWNWKLLHSMKVTSQEYVVLFSDDAGDLYARGVCDKFYRGEWNVEKYGDSFKKKRK